VDVTSSSVMIEDVETAHGTLTIFGIKEQRFNIDEELSEQRQVLAIQLTAVDQDMNQSRTKGASYLFFCAINFPDNMRTSLIHFFSRRMGPFTVFLHKLCYERPLEREVRE
jgi:hypothetical protein